MKLASYVYVNVNIACIGFLYQQLPRQASLSRELDMLNQVFSWGVGAEWNTA